MRFKIAILIIVATYASMLPSLVLGQRPHDSFELPLNDDQNIERITMLRDGIIVSQVEASTKANSQPNRRYIILDTSLKLMTDSAVQIPFRNKRMAFCQTQTSATDFFYDYRKGNFSLVNINGASITIKSGRIPNKIYEPQIIAGDQSIFVLDRRVHKERVLFKLSFADKTISTSVARVKKHTRVFPMYFNKINNSDEVAYIWREKNSKVDDVYVIVWSEDGEKILRYAFKIPEKKIYDVSIRATEEGNYVITGTYSPAGSTMATGAFVAFMDEDLMMDLKTYSFSDLPHYFDYLDKYEKEEMIRRLARLKKHEKSTEIGSHAISHNVQWVDNSFLLAIEFYTETYSDQYGLTRNGNTIAGSPQNFNGFDFSHALVLRFDSLGIFKRDYFFPFKLEYLAQKREMQLQTRVVNDTLLVGYAALHTLYFGKIRPMELAEFSVDTTAWNEPGVIRKEAKFFYLNNSTIVEYGFKTINVENGLKKKADIYFIEKRKVR